MAARAGLEPTSLRLKGIDSTRAYFNVQLMTICAVVKCSLQLKNGNCAVVVVNFELEQWKSVEKNGEKREIF